MAKQVEDDKRGQRKRTSDELYDEELDRGKVKQNFTQICTRGLLRIYFFNSDEEGEK